MKKSFTLAAFALFGLLMMPLANANDDAAEAQAECEKYAKEDGISAENLADYLQECVDSIMHPEAATGEGSDDEGKERQ